MTDRIAKRPCPSCAEPVPSRASFCTGCGARLRGSAGGVPSALGIVGVILLVLLALPVGLVGGGCLVNSVWGGGLDAAIGPLGAPVALGSIGILAVAVGFCLLAGRLLAPAKVPAAGAGTGGGQARRR